MIRRRLLVSVDEGVEGDECSDPVVHSNFDSDSCGDHSPTRNIAALDSSGIYSRHFNSDVEDFDSTGSPNSDSPHIMPISPSIKFNDFSSKHFPFIETPPYKQVRALRLVESPQTPKTLFWRSNVQTDEQPRLRGRLFPTPKNKDITKDGQNNPEVNVNPFTPDGILQQKKIKNKRRRMADFSLSKSHTEDFLDELEDDSEDELAVPPKRLHLRDTSVSRYEKEFFEVCQIGKGEFGSVYKCIHRLDGCTYAIKKSRQPLRNGTAEERIALNEVCAHAVIGAHPHVVRYHSAWAEDGHMVIQSEFCNGGSLADAIEANARAGSHFPESELKRILFHIAEGLHHFHSHNLAHLDIKPGNIFISRKDINCSQDSMDDGLGEEECDNVYKIGDLGHVTSLEAPQVEEGDCRYLPQEILNEDFSQLAKADIFALGLTVVEAAGACGPLPRNGEDWQAIRKRGQLPALPPGVGPALRSLLAGMIHPDPSLRPTAQDLLQDPVLSPLAHKTKAQLRRALNAERIKNVKLERKLFEASSRLSSTPINNSQQLPAAHNGSGMKASSRFHRSYSNNF